MTLRAYLRILRERWRLVALFVLVGTGMAALVTMTSGKIYQADVEIFVATNDTSQQFQYQNAAFTQTQVQTFTRLATANQVLAPVSEQFGLSQARLRSMISATAPTGQSIVDIHVQDASPRRATDVANATADSFVAFVSECYKARADERCGSSATAAPSASASSGTQDSGQPASLLNLVVTSKAAVPGTPVSPKPLLNVSLGFLLGLLIGAALAVVRDILDNRVKDPEALSKVAGKPTMGIVIDDPGTSKFPIATRAGTRNARAENFRQLRANLQFANIDKHPRVIAVTSSIPGEGKTMVSLNLASALSEAGFTVCLVDADLRRPTVAKVLGLAEPVGLTSVLIHQIGLSEAMQSAGPNLYVLSSGPIPPNPSEVLASTYVRDIIRSLLDKVDYVVLDTAPLLPVSDGSEVAALADGTLLVARYQTTTDNQIKRAVSTLRGVDATLIGVVLNRAPRRRTGEYGYSYSYYARETKPEVAPRRRIADRRPAPTRAADVDPES